MSFGVSVQICHIVCFKVTIGTRLQEGGMAPCMLLQFSHKSAGKVAVVFRTWKLYSAMHFSFMIPQDVFIFEYLFAVLAEIDNLIVFLQEVALQWLSFSALVFTVLTFQPVCKDPWLLACHRGQGHTTSIPQFRRSAHLVAIILETRTVTYKLGVIGMHLSTPTRGPITDLMTGRWRTSLRKQTEAL